MRRFVPGIPKNSLTCVALTVVKTATRGESTRRVSTVSSRVGERGAERAGGVFNRLPAAKRRVDRAFGDSVGSVVPRDRCRVMAPPGVQIPLGNRHQIFPGHGPSSVEAGSILRGCDDEHLRALCAAALMALGRRSCRGRCAARRVRRRRAPARRRHRSLRGVRREAVDGRLAAAGARARRSQFDVRDVPSSGGDRPRRSRTWQAWTGGGAAERFASCSRTGSTCTACGRSASVPTTAGRSGAAAHRTAVSRRTAWSCRRRSRWSGSRSSRQTPTKRAC